MTAFPSNEEDASLMMAASQARIPTDKNSSDKSNNSNTDALARSNLLRLETAELVKEATLHLHPNGNDSSIHYEAKWAPMVRGYISNLSSVLSALDSCTLSPDVCLISSSSASGGGVKEKGMEQLSGGGLESTKYRVPLQSDKFLKSLPGGSSTASTTPWTFPFSGKVKLVPIGSYAHIGNAGLTNRHANGNVVPTLDLAVLVKGGDGEKDAFVGGKDYLNHRFTDKQNILAVHIAKQLSHKKHRSKIGSVHLTRVFGDSRKVALLLTPPPAIDNDDKKKGKDKKKKRKRGEDDTDGGKKMKNKLRFHVRLIFGVEQQQSQDNSNHQQNDEDDDDDESMDREGSYDHGTQPFQSWIPISRLFPNRSNNRGADKLSSTESTDIHYHSTPHYNNALSESLHLQSTTNLISDTISNMFFGSTTVATPTTTFHETLLLIKVWALQRGLLRGHDSFTTTTIALILVYLYRTKTIGKRMGSVQAFTTFMKFWSEVDWLGEDAATTSSATTASSASTPSSSAQLLARKMKRKAAFVIPADGKNESQTIAGCPQARHYREGRSSSSNDDNVPMTLLDCYKQCFTTASSSSSSIPNDCHSDSPILLDPTMTINYLARLSPSFVRESRAEAYAALRCIHGQERDGGIGSSGSVFRKLFLETNRFWTRYDAYVRIPLGVVPKMVSQRGGKKKHPGKSGSAGVDGDTRVWGRDVEDLGYDESVCRGVVEVLHRALGDRVTAIRIFTQGNGDIRKDGTSSSDLSVESLGTKAIENSDQCYAVPIRGSGSTGTLGFEAKSGGRPPEPPVHSLNQDEPCLVVGLRIDPNGSRRVVDRGPPAEDVEGSKAFVALWGDHAQLRRFQDGAIVRAVVWNLPASSSNSVVESMPQFAGMDRSMGGIVEKVVQHIVKLHFTESKLMKKGKAKQVSFELRNVVGFVDGVLSSKPSPVSDSFTLHKNVMSAFDSLAEFLRQNSITVVDHSLGKEKKVSKLGLPLKIDEVEPLSPSLRYSSLFPPVPHPLLGGTDLGIDKRKVSGAVVGTPVLIQIRFEGSSKWPTSLNAMGAAKCAMLIQLAEGIEKMKQSENLDEFDGPIDVTPTYLDIGYRGYSWRVIVRADQELRMLKNLRNPTDEAKALRLSLINRHVRGSMHHSLIHAVHTRHPSSSLVSRLAHRWVASHMLSDMIPQEAIELIVAKIYTDPHEGAVSKIQSLGMPPSTVVAGFFRFLHVLSTHDWANEPLIVDPQSHITAHDRGLILAQFNSVRGPDRNNGPAMYIISPADYDGVEEMTGSKVVGEDGSAKEVADDTTGERVWSPTYTSKFPERVVLHRAAALAKCSHDHLTSCIMNGSSGSSWVAAFQESSASLTSYSALLRVDNAFVTDNGCCSTNADSVIGATSKQDSNGDVASPFERSLLKRYAGPKDLRKKMYKNLVLEKGTLHEWHPVKSLISKLRSKYGEYAVFFYNEFSPDIIAMIWRPAAFVPRAFSAMMSEFQSPVLKLWKDDSLVTTNTDDLMSEIVYAGRDILSDVKVLDDKKPDSSQNEGK